MFMSFRLLLYHRQRDLDLKIVYVLHRLYNAWWVIGENIFRTIYMLILVGANLMI